MHPSIKHVKYSDFDNKYSVIFGYCGREYYKLF